MSLTKIKLSNIDPIALESLAGGGGIDSAGVLSMLARSTLYLDSANDRVGVGTNSPGSKLTVDGTVYASGFIEGYNGIYTEIRGQNLSSPTNGYFYLDNDKTTTTASSSRSIGLQSDVVWSSSGDLNYTAVGGSLVGVIGTAGGSLFGSNKTITQSTGVLGYPTSNIGNTPGTNGCRITNLVGVEGVTGGGYVTNSISFKASGSDYGTPVTNQYGFYSNINPTRATNSWSFYANDSAPSYFNGRVGIGTLSPSTKLDVNGTVTATAFAGPLTGNVTGNADTVTNGVYTSGDQTIGGSKTFSNDVTISSRMLMANVSSPNTATMQFGDNTGWVFRMMTNVSGTPTVRYSFTDQGNFTATGNVTSFSDERLKTNIRTIPNALSLVQNMRGVLFDKDGKAGVGVIAQEMENVLPEVVHTGEEYKSVAYGNVVGVLIEAIKQLKAEIDELKSSKQD